METQIHNQVWAVVVTYNASKWIDACLNSLRASTIKPKVIVIDNQSSDTTVEQIKVNFPDVKILCNSVNIGFGHANNQGIKVALDNGAEFIFLLNQDAKIDKTAISFLLGVAAKYPEFGIISPIHLSYDGGQIDPHTNNYLCASIAQLLTDFLFNQVQDIYEVPFFPAAAWLVRDTALKDVGGFDPLFFMNGEDYDLCLRFKKRNWKIGIALDAFAYHWHGGFYKQKFTVKTFSIDLYWETVVKLKKTDRPFVRNCLAAFYNSTLKALAFYCFRTEAH